MDPIIKTEERILASALKEFGEKGYFRASTNNIAKEAMLAKGSIFKHFTTKADLFFAVYRQALDKFLQAYEQFQIKQSQDIFEQISDFIFWKSQYMQENRLAANVLLEAVANPPEVIKDKCLATLASLRKLSLASFFAKIDMSHLNPHISQEVFERNLNIAISGLQATYIDKNINYATLSALKEEAIAFLKIVIKGMEK
jgi:TetR/AcrR family transcriptional regulator